MQALITAQIFSCFFMTGVIWTIQLVHYPAFCFSKEQFELFHKFHSARITWVVLPVMATELLSAAIIAYLNPSIFWMSNFASVLVVWGATAFLSVPQHNKLSRSYDPTANQKLTSTNWVRTLTWTGRAMALIYNLIVL